MKLSIVTPSYNQGEFLEQCIDSVLSQTAPAFEYIILDGGSTDNSLEIIKKYERHLTYWTSGPDEGQSDAINTGFKRATGDLVAWINSDDFYLQDAFHFVENAYTKDPESSFYYGNGILVNRAGENQTSFYSGGTVEFDLEAITIGLNYILQPSTFINRRRLAAIGYLDCNLEYAMDTDLWIRLGMQCPPKPMKEVIAASREYEDTKTSTGAFERCDELRRLAKRHSGEEMSPGALLYLLNTMYQYIKNDDSNYASDFEEKLVNLSAHTAKHLANRCNVGLDGFPLNKFKDEL
jgi:glycosyltransferase involved in cell wall biosynthesis